VTDDLKIVPSSLLTSTQMVKKNQGFQTWSN
jgi:hypothetical protein